MRNLLLLALFCPLVVIGQRFGGYTRVQPNTVAPYPIQVMGEGRVEKVSPGTTINDQISSNQFAGFWKTNYQYLMYTNGGTTKPTIETWESLANSYGFFMPTVTQPIQTTPATNQCFYYQCDLQGDVCPRASWAGVAASVPTVMVVGFTMSISNWTGATFRGYDLVRIGQDPYAILQFNDDPSQFPPNGQVVLVHTPDGAGVGSPVIVLDNGEVYDFQLLFDGFRSNAAVRAVQRLPNGNRKLAGVSTLALSNGQSNCSPNCIPSGAGAIWFGQNDDHGAPNSGGKIRIGHFYMSTNREIFYDNQWPRF